MRNIGESGCHTIILALYFPTRSEAKRTVGRWLSVVIRVCAVITRISAVVGRTENLLGVFTSMEVTPSDPEPHPDDDVQDDESNNQADYPSTFHDLSGVGYISS